MARPKLRTPGFPRIILVGLLAGMLPVVPGRTLAQVPATMVSGASGLPTRLTDAEFWKLERDISEPGGSFRIVDNFTSNEPEVAQLFTQLRASGVTGGVYMGVGPEQNLSYMASIRPAFAFICDIRRQAVMQHLMYKAMFELSADRADFISILFSKPRPKGLDSTTAIDKLWDAFWYIPTDTALGRRNIARVEDQLTKKHGFTFTSDEASQLRWVLEAFQIFGPVITTQSGGGGGGMGGVNNNTFADLTGYMRDAGGVTQSFLSTEDNFRYLKSLHEANLIVPVSGDFGGPKAIRAIGAWLKEHNGVVSAFYVSNVEQYLFQDGKAANFYGNVGTLPVSEKSVFIRPYSMRNRGGYYGGTGTTQSLCPMESFLKAATAGRVYSNDAALSCPS